MERVLRGRRDGRSWVGGDLSSEPPLPETTSRPSHIQINTKPVGCMEGLQIRRQGAGVTLEDGFSATLKPI